MADLTASSISPSLRPITRKASLVKVMEELGIGRPSTYAPTITTLLARRYVAKENKNLYITELGEVVNNMMKEAFPSIVDVNFTAIWKRCWTVWKTAPSSGKPSCGISTRILTLRSKRRSRAAGI